MPQNSECRFNFFTDFRQKGGVTAPSNMSKVNGEKTYLDGIFLLTKCREQMLLFLPLTPVLTKFSRALFCTHTVYDYMFFLCLNYRIA